MDVFIGNWRRCTIILHFLFDRLFIEKLKVYAVECRLASGEAEDVGRLLGALNFYNKLHQCHAGGISVEKCVVGEHVFEEFNGLLIFW